jgi:hypothetical protein
MPSACMTWKVAEWRAAPPVRQRHTTRDSSSPNRSQFPRLDTSGLQSLGSGIAPGQDITLQLIFVSRQQYAEAISSHYCLQSPPGRQQNLAMQVVADGAVTFRRALISRFSR